MECSSSNVLGIREVRKLIEIKEGLLKHLAEKLSEKNEEAYHITIIWIRTLLSFEILRSVTHMCKRLQDTFSQNSTRGYH